jgi:LuxR family transcriptional regulator, maltose regulon positive regulatory protein
LVTRGADSDLQSALQILDALDEIADRTHNTRFKIVLLALRALALDALGKASEATGELKQALELARPGGFVRMFVDLGKPMQKMLGQLAKQDKSMKMIHRILEAFPQDDVYPVNGENAEQPMRQPSPGNSTLAEPLTRRELEVLTLLQEPLTIKEIAEKLYISHTTVKRHTTNIYGKLGVNRRKDATARALELKILSTD